MEIVESSGVIPQEQHGVRSGNMSIEVELLISLFFDYVIQTRRNASLVSYVAEDWYECVSQNCFSLTDKYFDIPLTSTIYFLKAIQ